MATLTAETVRAALAAFDGVEWGADAVQYKNSISGDDVQLYDWQYRLVTVRAPETLRYTGKGFLTAAPSAALSGTAIAGGVLESEIVTGGETIIITLTNGEWIDSGFDDIRQSIIDGITGSVEGGTGWDEKVQALLDVDDVVRTSDTVVTVTTDAAAEYDISEDETITVEIPANAIAHPSNPSGLWGSAVSAGTFVVSNEA